MCECNYIKGNVHDALWYLVRVFDGDEKCKGDAETLCDKIFSSFIENEIPLSNEIGFCSDTCNLMIGSKNSVASHLKELIPGIKVIKCACNIQHRCARNVIKKLPAIFEQILHLVSNYINSSPNRLHRWEVLQKQEGQSSLKPLKPLPIKWLSFFDSTSSLSNSHYFSHYFSIKNCNLRKKKEQYENLKIICDYFNDPINKAYHLFIMSIYTNFYAMNKKLQHKKPVIGQLVKNLYIDFLKMYMNEEYLNNTPIMKINANKDSEWKPLNSILLSTEVILALKSMTDFIDLEKFLTNCRNVIIESCNWIKQRWNFDSVPLEFTNPQNALDEKYHTHNPDLYEVLFEFPHLKNSYDDKLMMDINVEWNKLTEYNFSTDFSQIKRADEFWDTIYKCVEKGQRLFTNISRFCLDILTFPVSNAASERVWSKLIIEKNPYRSRLNFSTTRALLLSCQIKQC